MSSIMKVREVTIKYDISARALKYYEDMGLLQSTKNNEYAYRLYDESAIKRLEQILILRKLNIKIRDIQRIFNTDSADVILDVLRQKITDIDDEAALLHELKDIVLDFIKQIQTFDFQNESDIKLLYEKINDIEQKITNVDYNGNPSTVSRLVQVAEKLEKTPDIRVIELPPCRMLTSGKETGVPFSEGGSLDRFDQFIRAMGKRRKDFAPRDFMWDDEGLVWNYALEDTDDESINTGNFKVIDFPGGLYAVAVTKDGDDVGPLYNHILKWINNNEHFEVAENKNKFRTGMMHIVTPEIFKEKMGYSLAEVFIPIDLRTV